jgi:hypothetical protein
VTVKGRSGAIVLHEAYEFDAPDLVRHKQATREDFERAGRLIESDRSAEALVLLERIIAAHPGDLAARRLHEEATTRMRAA